MSRFNFLFQQEIRTTQERMAFVNFKDLLGGSVTVHHILCGKSCFRHVFLFEIG